MKKRILISILTLFLGFQGMAQYILPKLEDVEKAKQRDVLVPLLEEDPKLVKKYSKDSQKLQKYQSGIKEFNHILETAVKREWTFSKVTLSTKEEVMSLLKQRNKNFTVLAWAHYEVSLENGYSWGRSVMTYRLSESSSPMMQICLPTFEMREADVVFGVQFFQQQLTYRLAEGKKANYDNMIRAHAAELPKKTLLINQADVRERFTLDEIKQNYPYPVEVVPYQQIERAILSKDPAYAFVMVAPTMAGSEEAHLQYVADAATGNVLGRSTPGMVTYKGVGAGIHVKPKHLKNYLDFVPKQ
jgi:hypothetical protein